MPKCGCKMSSKGKHSKKQSKKQKGRNEVLTKYEKKN